MTILLLVAWGPSGFQGEAAGSLSSAEDSNTYLLGLGGLGAGLI